MPPRREKRQNMAVNIVRSVPRGGGGGGNQHFTPEVKAGERESDAVIGGCNQSVLVDRRCRGSSRTEGRHLAGGGLFVCRSVFSLRKNKKKPNPVSLKAQWGKVLPPLLFSPTIIALSLLFPSPSSAQSSALFPPPPSTLRLSPL